MAGKKVEKISEEELNRRHARFLVIWDRSSRVAVHLVWGGVTCVFVYYGVYSPIVETAGQQTIISMTASWLADVHGEFVISAATAGAAGIGWWRERRRRCQEREEKDRRIEILEKQLDPNRSSSNLDPSGKPKKGGKK